MSGGSETRRVGQVKEVTSLANPLVKDIKALSLKKFRDEQHAFMAEGLKLVIDALDLGWSIRTLVFAKSARGNQAVRIRRAQAVDLPALLEVDRACFGPQWNKDESIIGPSILDAPYFMVAEIDGRRIGIVLLNSFGTRTPQGDATRVRRWLESESVTPVAGAALANAGSALHAASMRSSVGYGEKSNSTRRAFASCGTRQMSASVGASPWQKCPVCGSRESRASSASNPTSIQ